MVALKAESGESLRSLTRIILAEESVLENVDKVMVSQQRKRPTNCNVKGKIRCLGAFWIFAALEFKVVSCSRTTQLAHEIKAKHHVGIGVFPKATANANDANGVHRTRDEFVG
jgi:hypothetical protein